MEKMDNTQRNNSLDVCAEDPDTGSGLTTQAILEGSVIHQAYFDLCKFVMKKRMFRPEKNTALLSAQQKYKDTLVLAENAMEAELAAAESSFILCQDDYKTSSGIMTDYQANLDEAMVIAIKNIPRLCELLGNSSQVNKYINDISKARLAIIEAKKTHEAVKDKLNIAEARYNFVKARCDTDMLLAKTRSEIESDLVIELLSTK